MMGLALFGQGITMALIALGIGYIVCDIADKQKDMFKSMGYFVGAIIIILSVVTLANAIISGVTLSKRIGGLGMGNMPQQRMMQPYMPPAMQQNKTIVK